MVVKPAIVSNPYSLGLELEHVFKLVERIDVLIANTSTATVVSAILQLLVETVGASSASVHIRDALTDELIQYCSVGQSPDITDSLPDSLTIRHPFHIQHVFQAETQISTDGLVLPLPGNVAAPGVVVVWESRADARALLDLIVRRLALELAHVQQIRLSERRDERLRIMLEVRDHIGATLDREHILDLIIDYARRLLHVEATSLFLVDPEW